LGINFSEEVIYNSFLIEDLTRYLRLKIRLKKALIYLLPEDVKEFSIKHRDRNYYVERNGRILSNHYYLR